MSDFEKFIAKGIKVAEDVKGRLAEVDSVLMSLSADLKKISSDKLYVEVDLTPVEHTLAAIVGMTAGKSKNAVVKEKSLYLVIINDGKKSRVPLAKWSQPSEVYPIKLTCDDLSLFCDDKRGLVSGLQEILSHPVNGEQFRALSENGVINLN